MINTITGGSAMQKTADYYDEQAVSTSKLTALVDRVRQAISFSDNARHTLGMELDRLLGQVPTSVSNGKPAEPRLNTGVVGELDDVLSELINSLELVNAQAVRLQNV